MDKLKQRGAEVLERDEAGQLLGPSEPNGESSERSAETTAQVVGTSASTVKRCRYIDKYATDEIKEAVLPI